METTIGYKYLRLIPNPKFNLWDVKRYRKSSSLSFENVVRLSDILTPYKNNVSKEEMIKNDWQIIKKINFGGELFLRYKEEINTYKGKLNLVPENAIIYSKINVRHGCIYFNEKGSKPFGVSTEYPTFLFDETKVNGFFLKKVLRSEEFKKLLNTKTSGISKARVKQNEFLNIEIPLPSLTEQVNIIKAYQKNAQKADKLLQKAKDLESEVEIYLYRELGIKKQVVTSNKKGLKVIEFTKTQRWDTLFLLGKIDTIQSKYPIKTFYDVITSFNKNKEGKSIRVDSSKKPNEDYKYIGMEHIEKETGTLLQLNDVKGKEIKSQTLNIPLNFFIYGKLRPYLNKYWINTTKYENIICSSEFLVFDINTKIVDKLFFKYVLRSQIIQNQISDKTSGARMPRINETIFYNLQFPLPEIIKQKSIAKKISELKKTITNSKEESKHLMQKAKTEFENIIFS